VARAVAKTRVVMTAPKRGPRASMMVVLLVEFETCVIFNSFSLVG
jgi:hypothetical protein